jgi:hypothetical protein
MVFCHTSGFDWDTVYSWNVDQFIDIYHALQRNDSRAFLKQFSCLQMAFGGDKKGVKEFISAHSEWLPNEERQGGVKRTDDFISLVNKGLKLKK